MGILLALQIRYCKNELFRQHSNELGRLSCDGLCFAAHSRSRCDARKMAFRELFRQHSRELGRLSCDGLCFAARSRSRDDVQNGVLLIIGATFERVRAQPSRGSSVVPRGPTNTLPARPRRPQRRQRVSLWARFLEPGLLQMRGRQRAHGERASDSSAGSLGLTSRKTIGTWWECKADDLGTSTL